MSKFAISEHVQIVPFFQYPYFGFMLCCDAPSDRVLYEHTSEG